MTQVGDPGEVPNDRIPVQSVIEQMRSKIVCTSEQYHVACLVEAARSAKHLGIDVDVVTAFLNMFYNKE